MNRFVNRFSNLLLILLYILPQIFLIIDSFGFVADDRLPLWIAALCLSVWVAASFRHGIFLSLPASALILYFAYRQCAVDLAAELADFFDKLTGAYYVHFYSPGSTYSYAYSSETHTLILLFLAFLLASYLSTALTSKNGRVLLSLLGTLPVFIGCIAVNGYPRPPVIFCLLLFWFLLLISGGSYDTENGSGRAMLISALPVGLVLALLLMACRPGEYAFDQTDVTLSQRFDRLGSAVSRWMGSREGETQLLSVDGTGGTEFDAPYANSWIHSGSIDLTESYDYSGQDSLVLRAKADTGGYLYLRGQSYGNYTGTGWLPVDEMPELSSLSFAARAAENSGQGEAHSIQLRFAASSDHLLLPYYSAMAGDSDVMVPSDGTDSYQLDYLDFDGKLSALSLPASLADAELAYRSYAHEIYTRLPDSTKSAMPDILSEAGISAASPDVIQRVAEYVQGHVSYDLDTQPYPSDDYAVYFFTQAQSGYCIHYATAAAVMYRALDIPARVTEGYLCLSQPGQYTDVRGENAHAWVEVYMDGLGWIPVEVTGSSAALPEEEDTNQEQPLPTSQLPDSTPGPEQPAAPEPVPSTEPLPVGVISQQTETEASRSTAEKLHIPWQTLLTVLAVLLLIMALPIWRALSRRAMKRAVNQPDRRKAVIAVWRLAKKTERFGGVIPQEITACAEKAAFSTHEISREDAARCRKYLTELAEQTYSTLKPYKKFLFKYFTGLK